ncbi:DNA-binding transcriptional LysR family regulator [Pseudochelatococcus lubricantis]|uniref:DNA-binding transcriptional LysR family regulator n=1 Tax=Pseudochelatococcus lubricantis TaxID=1538102 RepID=A0ABX0V0U0_9HYPH|nr:DNA-binding transcriptional LysR family regulator [Pseudochelatococcus lubricantis]
MNFRQIEAFNAVMAVGTTTRAAELLGVSQPAISRLIKQLEKATQLTLFERINGRLVPTFEGSLFHKEVDRSFLVLERLKMVAADIRNYGSGNLRIAALPALGFSLIPFLISRFMQENQARISISMESANSDAVRDLVAAGQFDVGFAAEEIDSTGVMAEQYAMPPAVCVMPVGHRLAERTVIEARDIVGEPFVSLSRTDRARQRIDAMFERVGGERNIVAETHYALSICHFVQHGLGIGLVNPYCLHAISTDSLAVRPFLPRITFRTMMIFPPQRPITGLTQSFRELAQKHSTSFLLDTLNRFDTLKTDEAKQAFGLLQEPGPWIRNPMR